MIRRWLQRFFLLVLCAGAVAPLYAAPGTVLFSDNFERASLGANWTSSGPGGAIGTFTRRSNGANVSISPTRVLYTCCQQTFITSKVFDLSAVAGARLDLSVIIGSDDFSEDPDIGGNEDFLIQYRNQSGNWVTLRTFLGGTNPGVTFTPSFNLPADALYASFRFRFYQIGGSGFSANGNGNGTTGWDFYHVDDVTLTETAAIPPIVGGFCDNFESGLGNWTVLSNGGDAGISGATFNSPSNSLFTRWGRVSVESRPMDFSAQTGVQVSLWVRRGSDAFSENPDLGEDLVVEYLNSSGVWVNLETFLGGGTQGQIFIRTYALPSSALFSGLKIRFRQTNGSGVNWDYWHIDDVCIQPPPPPPAALAEYQFEQTAFSGPGVAITDASTNGLNGLTLGNVATNVLGKVCMGVDIPYNTTTAQIDAIDSRIDVDSQIGNVGTIMFWIRPNWRWNNNNRRQTLFDAGIRIFNSFQDKYFYLERNRRQLRFALEDSNDLDFNVTTNVLSGTAANTWIHITATWDLPNNRLQLYVNGALVRTANIASNGQIGNLGSLIFGDAKTNYIVSGRSADARYDEIKIFQGVLSAADIVTAMNATHPCTRPINHFTITHDNFGLYCLAEPITVAAKDSSNNTLAGFNQTVVLSTQSGKGTWSLLSGNGIFNDAIANDGQATYTYAVSDNGVAQFALDYREGSTPINILAALQSNGAITDDNTEGLLSWAPSGFIATLSRISNPPPNPINDPLPTQIAGTSFNWWLTAYGQTPTDPQCGVIESYTGNKPLNFWATYQNPATGTVVPSVNGTAIASSQAASTTQTVVFSNGQAQLSSKYKDVGSIKISVKDADLVSHLNVIQGATNAFVVKPAELRITIPGNPAAIDANGAVFKKAGAAFTVKVDVLDAEGSITPNYGNETVAEGIKIRSSQLIAPLGGRNGSVAGTMGNDTAFTKTAPGQFSNTNTFFDEVGIIRLQAEIADANYLTGGNVLGSESVNVGRFIPDRFSVIDNAPQLQNGDNTWACPFSYQSQPIDFAPGLNPVLSVQALASAGTPTFNYGNSFWKLSTTLAGRSYINQVPGISAVLAWDSSAASVTASGLNDLVDGRANYTISGEKLRWDKAAATPVANDAPFNAAAQLSVPVADLTDTDGVCFDANNDNLCDVFNGTTIGGTQLRYGRVQIENAFGSELFPLPMAAQTQQFNGSLFVINANDTCSAAHSSWVVPTLSAYSGNLQAGETLLTQGTQVAGVIPLTLSAPGNANDGSVLVTVPAPTWLFYDFNGNGLAAPPSATATFGIYSGRQPVIYWRQRYGN